MLQMPARVKFITSRGPGSLVHGVGNHLPRVKHFADNDHALTKPILQERRASKHQSCSWVHREDIGAVGRRAGLLLWGEQGQAAIPAPVLKSFQRGHRACVETRGREGRTVSKPGSWRDGMGLRGPAYLRGGLRLTEDSLWPEGFNSIFLFKPPELAERKEFR